METSSDKAQRTTETTQHTAMYTVHHQKPHNTLQCTQCITKNHTTHCNVHSARLKTHHNVHSAPLKPHKTLLEHTLQFT